MPVQGGDTYEVAQSMSIDSLIFPNSFHARPRFGGVSIQKNSFNFGLVLLPFRPAEMLDNWERMVVQQLATTNATLFE